MANKCKEIAEAYQFVLENLTAQSVALTLETRGKKKPNQDEVKRILQNAASIMRDEEASNLNLRGAVDSISDLIKGIDKGDLPIRGDAIARHYEDIVNNIWDNAWQAVSGCNCGQ